MSTTINSLIHLDKICAVNFAPFCPCGSFTTPKARESLAAMKERTAANFVILTPNGLMDTPNSEKIDYTSQATVSDDELKEMIAYAQKLGLAVALKPTANCKNGTWRAHINFFDEDVPCEPKWHNWFDSYAAFQRHYARIAEEMGCVMHIAGCEMVMSERRANEWRQLISDIRLDFKGPVSYNTDKYQEHNVSWWDCVDIISSSGYYPLLDWNRQLDRIEAVVNQFDKPFFFAETGCMSVSGSEHVPNDWGLSGNVDLKCQADWYETMFETTLARKWVGGWGLWSWTDKLYAPGSINTRGDYEIFNKPCEAVIKRYYEQITRE